MQNRNRSYTDPGGVEGMGELAEKNISCRLHTEADLVKKLAASRHKNTSRVESTLPLLSTLADILLCFSWNSAPTII